MGIVYIEQRGVWVDEDSGYWNLYKTNVQAFVKTLRLGLPVNDFLSNRFILNNIEVEE